MHRRRLYPESALCTTSFWVALVVLVLNDHVLKGASLLPGWVTGKLSDFAGLYVAPPILCAVVRARSERGLLACFASVGLVFSAIQLDVNAADAWAVLMARAGFPWSIVADPTDLLALPMLAIAYAALQPAMRAAPSGRARRAVGRLGLGFGLLCCMATSPNDNFGESFGQLRSQGPHIHNASDRSRVVNIQTLKDSVVLDCEEVAQDPGRLLPRSAFGAVEAFLLRRLQNLATRPPTRSDCNALLVTGEDLIPAVLFWRDTLGGAIPTEYASEDEFLEGAVILEFNRDGEQAGYRSIGPQLAFELDETPAETSASCTSPNDSTRIAVDSAFPRGGQRLVGVSSGYDGCYRLEFRSEALPTLRAPATADPSDEPFTDEDAGVADPGDEPMSPLGVTTSSYLCLPGELLPFGVGDLLLIDVLSQDMLRMRAVQDERLDGSSLLVTRALGTVVIAGLPASVRGKSRCAYEVDDECAQVVRPATLRVEDGETVHELEVGDPPLTLTGRNGVRATVALAFAQTRPLLDTACAQGSTLPGDEAEVVVVTGGEDR